MLTSNKIGPVSTHIIDARCQTRATRVTTAQGRVGVGSVFPGITVVGTLSAFAHERMSVAVNEVDYTDQSEGGNLLQNEA